MQAISSHQLTFFIHLGDCMYVVAKCVANSYSAVYSFLTVVTIITYIQICFCYTRTLLPTAQCGRGFHAIDTSNVMDYVGAWNLVLACLPSLASPEPSSSSTQLWPYSPFIFTEQIIGQATTIDNMLLEVLPFSKVRYIDCPVPKPTKYTGTLTNEALSLLL